VKNEPARSSDSCDNSLAVEEVTIAMPLTLPGSARWIS